MSKNKPARATSVHSRKTKVWVFHKMKKEYLKSMRRMDENEKIVDIRVQDPEDEIKDYSTLSPGDILHFEDTDGEVLRVFLSRITAYHTVKEALEDVGYTNVFPEAKSLDEAEEKCLSLGRYREILDSQEKGNKPIYALWFMRYMFYVAGPYTATKAKPGTPEAEAERRKNIEQAILTGKDIMRLGYIPIVPHSLFDGWENLPGLNEGIVVMAEKAAVARCEGFFKIAPSRGTNNEEKLAKAFGKDIFTDIEQVRLWKPTI